MAKKDSGGVDRRAFLAGIGAAGAATAAVAAAAKPAPAEAQPATLPPVSQSHATAIAALEEAPPAAGASVDAWHVAAPPGSDYMVDVLIALGYKYVAAIPGTTFRGLQESVVNHAIGKMEWITCVHEEISGAIAHGYYKAAGKPMAFMVHNTVGLQHATMAIFNAWADRVPTLCMLGNYADGTLRAPMSARVVSVRVRDGERCGAGDVVVVLEAMKMEHSLRLGVAATIANVRVREGGQVGAGEILLTYDAAG